MIMFFVGSAFGLVTLVYVIVKAFGKRPGEIGGLQLQGAFRRISAVARTTLAEGIRAKIASGFIVVILVSVPLFWLTAAGDGTIKGRVQMFIAYSMGFTAFMLSILTILFSCRSLSNEIASRQIFGIVSKPIPRWQILAGKWMGVMSLNVLLIAVIGGLTILGSRLIMGEFKRSLRDHLVADGGLTPQLAEQAVAALDHVSGIGKQGLESPVLAEMAKATGMPILEFGDVLLKLPESMRVDLRRADEVRRQVLISRAWATPQLPDISKSVREMYEKAKENGQLPPNMSERETLQAIEQQLLGQFKSAPPGATLEWKMQGPPPKKDQDFILSLRFKMQTSKTVDAAEFPGGALEQDTMLCLWGVGDPASAESAVLEGPQPVNTFQEVELPTYCIRDDGSFVVAFANIDPRKVEVFFDLPDGLQVLYRVGSFELNVMQTCLALLVPIACLASIGVCASTFLSFPVGTLIVVVLYIIASSSNFIADSLAVTSDYQPDLASISYKIRKASVDIMEKTLSIGDIDPVNDLIEGRSIGWKSLWTIGWQFALLKSSLAMFIGVLVFRRRELAAVIV